jgi:transmembrane sensor
MIDSEACLWAVRIDRGLANEESDALSDWLTQDARHRGALLRAQAGMLALNRARALESVQDDAGEAHDEPGRRRFLRYGAMAAAAGIVAACGWSFWPVMGRQFDTRLGEVRRLPLDDGSLAVLNSRSVIKVAYSANRRDVALREGEAWFEVAHNRARPFTVSAGPARVQAVGTAFDVRRHQSFTEVVVTEGRVKLWSQDSTSDWTLVSAGHRAILSDGGTMELTQLSQADMGEALAWREGRIVLDNITLGAAAETFNRYNQVQLEVDPELAGRRLVGWFRTDDLQGFVTASAALVNGKVQANGSVIRIVKK